MREPGRAGWQVTVGTHEEERMTLVTGSDPRDPDGSGIVPIWLAHLGGLSWRLLAIGALILVAAVLAAQLFVATASVLVDAINAATFTP